MAHYPYDPALPAPGKWTGIDFSNPGLQPALRMLVRSIYKDISQYATPAGVCMSSRQITCRDGETITCYIFEPEMAEEKLPAMLYCHGGGFFLPVQPMQMALAAQYAKELSIRVWLPEYRIYPDYSGAYPFEDCRRVLEEMLAELGNGDAARQNGTAEGSGAPGTVGGVADNAAGADIGCGAAASAAEGGTGELTYLLYGESAGGMLAASLALECRRMGWRSAAGQLLIYPALDNRGLRYPSMQKYRDAAWPLKNNLAMWREYLQNKLDYPEEILIPMRASDLTGLPRTYIEPQEVDILRDEAIAYAKRLQEAGVDVFSHVVKGSYHGFDSNTDNAFVQAVVEERIRRMQEMLRADAEDCRHKVR